MRYTVATFTRGSYKYRQQTTFDDLVEATTFCDELASRMLVGGRAIVSTYDVQHNRIRFLHEINGTVPLECDDCHRQDGTHNPDIEH